MNPEAEQWIAVVGWDRFQHRDPARGEAALPWIRQYTSLMDSDEYLDLTEHCALIFHRLLLVYAKSGCRLHADTRKLSRKLDMRVTKSHLESLNHAGLIRICASSAMAARWHSASSRALEVEVEVEKTVTVTSPEVRPLGAGSEGEGSSTSSVSVNGDGSGSSHKSDYDLPSPEQRPNIEGDDSIERLDPVEELVKQWTSRP